MVRLELQDVHRTHRSGAGRVAALAGVTLTVDGPGFVTVVGPSGSGKTTLLQLVGGMDTPTSGRILVDGTDLSTLDDRARSEYRRRRVGVVFQSFNLLARLSAEENVAVPCLLDGVPWSAARERAGRALERVGLAGLARRRPAELSGGQMQRVAVARALVMDPPLLLADEPTGNLDSAAGDQVVAELRRAVDEDGRTVVMVTHNLRAARHSDRVVVLHDGTVRSDGPPSVLAEHLEVR